MSLNADYKLLLLSSKLNWKLLYSLSYDDILFRLCNAVFEQNAIVKSFPSQGNVTSELLRTTDV